MPHPPRVGRKDSEEEEFLAPKIVNCVCVCVGAFLHDFPVQSSTTPNTNSPLPPTSRINHIRTLRTTS
jgi:hypothetical protein